MAGGGLFPTHFFGQKNLSFFDYIKKVLKHVIYIWIQQGFNSDFGGQYDTANYGQGHLRFLL
jgi:hypothetical protein